MSKSLFHICGVGYAAENKKQSTVLLEVYMPELSGYVDGEITADKEVVEVSGEDAFGNAYTVKCASSNSIQATWIPFGSNRKTAPDIRRGERVVVYRYADTDMYYWGETGLDEHLRRLETVIYTFSNTKDESVKELTPDNSWYVEFSTHKKMITLKTNKSDGENVEYGFQFDINKGLVVLADDLGNYFELDSFNRVLTLKNADESLLTIDKTNILMSSSDSIALKTKAYTLDCTTTAVTASTATLKASTYGITAITSIKGNTDVLGTFGVVGATAFSGGGFSLTGSGAITGNVTIDGTLLNNNINVGSTHKHTTPHGVSSTPY